jgi:hypothetical protein
MSLDNVDVDDVLRSDDRIEAEFTSTAVRVAGTPDVGMAAHPVVATSESAAVAVRSEEEALSGQGPITQLGSCAFPAPAVARLNMRFKGETV